MSRTLRSKNAFKPGLTLLLLCTASCSALFVDGKPLQRPDGSLPDEYQCEPEFAARNVDAILGLPLLIGSLTYFAQSPEQTCSSSLFVGCVVADGTAATVAIVIATIGALTTSSAVVGHIKSRRCVSAASRPRPDSLRSRPTP